MLDREDHDEMSKNAEAPTPQEFIVTHRSESGPPDTGKKIEQIAKILSLVAIPLVIAAFGWTIQNLLSQRSLGKDYVQLAVSILTKEADTVDPALREWAVDLLNDNSPTRFSPEIAAQLKSGELTLPAFLSKALSGPSAGGTLAVSPDGTLVATAHEDGYVRVWKLDHGELVGEMIEHEDAVTSVAFSANGKLLISGSMDRTANVYEIEHMRIRVKVMAHKTGVNGVAFSPDSRHIITRSMDGTLIYWDSFTGQELQRVQLGEQ